MTIALGVLAKDGVVIAADTEETLGEIIKYSTKKVRGAAHYYTHGGRGRGRFLLVAGAGHGHYIDAFSEVLEGMVNAKDDRLDSEPQRVIDEALERFYLRKIVPFARYPSEERPEFRVVIGLVTDGGSHLFVSEGATLRRENYFAAIGSGALVARPLISSYIGHLGARSMSIREAAIVAALAVHEAKSVTGVGGDTDILALWDNGSMARIVPPDYAPLEQIFKHYNQVLRPAVLRAVIGINTPAVIAAEIERLRESIIHVLDPRFEPVAVPIKPPTQSPPKRGRKGRTP